MENKSIKRENELSKGSGKVSSPQGNDEMDQKGTKPDILSSNHFNFSEEKKRHHIYINHGEIKAATIELQMNNVIFFPIHPDPFCEKCAKSL